MTVKWAMSRGPKSELRWVSWAAVSSAPQAKKISLQDQLETNRRHVEQHGGEVIEELVVPGVSRSIVLFEDACNTIEAYARLRDLIANRSFDVLIYLDRSRLGRKASLSMAIVELCHEAGIIPYEVESPPATLDSAKQTLDAMLLGAIKSTMAQSEVMKIKERNRMGMLARARKGKHPSHPPYGYRVVYSADGTKHVEPHPDEADGIRLFYDLYVNHGLSIEEIGHRLLAAGYTPRQSAEWSHTSLTYIRNNVWMYAGRLLFGRTSRRGSRVYAFDAEFEPLITPEIARAVEAEAKRRWPGSRSVNSPRRYSQVLICDACGESVNAKGHGIGYKSPRYCCRRQCRGGSIMEHVIDKALYAAIKYLVGQTDLQAIADDDGHDELAYEREQLATRKARLAAIAEQRERLTLAYTRDIIGLDEYEQVMTKLAGESAELNAEVEELETQLATKPDPSSRLHRLEEIRERGYAMIETDDIAEANAWLRRHFRVYIWKNRVSGVQFL